MALDHDLLSYIIAKSRRQLDWLADRNVSCARYALSFMLTGSSGRGSSHLNVLTGSQWVKAVKTPGDEHLQNLSRRQCPGPRKCACAVGNFHHFIYAHLQVLILLIANHLDF